MAPSRAVLRCAQLLSTTSRVHTPTFSSACIRPSPLMRLCQTTQPQFNSPIRRLYSQNSSTPPDAPDYLNEAELHIFNKIKAELSPVKLEVQDISGGCGSMYALEIESAKFKGLPTIKQHKMVNAILADEIKIWHGLQLRTKAA